MNKNTDKVPAGVAALYADIIAHPAEAWKASGSELPYLVWVEQQKAAKNPVPAKIYKVWAQVELVDCAAGTEENVSEPVELKAFHTKAAAEKFVAELEDFA
ncbi:MAG: hypothetical protein WC047_09260 [Kiritimatiellales bacterium]